MLSTYIQYYTCCLYFTLRVLYLDYDSRMISLGQLVVVEINSIMSARSPPLLNVRNRSINHSIALFWRMESILYISNRWRTIK